MLAPLRDEFIQKKISANQITLFTCLLCIVYASLFFVIDYTRALLAFFPLFLFIRMALNALDGMVAVATSKQTALGSVLNETCDVISDLFLFGAFVSLFSVSTEAWWLLIFLNMMIEFVALAVYQANGKRPFSGPFSKSDRALYLGLLALLLLLFPDTFILFQIYIYMGIALAFITLWNRFKMIKL